MTPTTEQLFDHAMSTFGHARAWGDGTSWKVTVGTGVCSRADFKFSTEAESSSLREAVIEATKKAYIMKAAADGARVGTVTICGSPVNVDKMHTQLSVQ